MNNPTSKKIQSVYFQNLDASRFLAAFAVFILHFSNEIKGLFPEIAENTFFKGFYLVASKGGLGVNFFFVLSGFLITFLILKEKKKYGQFNLGKFLIRRTLRIWPLYFIIGIIGFVLFPILFSDYSTVHQPLNYFFFLANFDEIWFGAYDSINFLTSPWSVAVEEQFYLFWGIVLFLLFRFNASRQKKFKIEYLLIFLYLISFLFQWINWQDDRIIYHHTLAVCQDILTGSFIGLSLFNGRKWLDKLQNISRGTTFLIYVIGLVFCIGKNKIFAQEVIIFERFVLSVFFAFIILDQIRGKHSFIKFGKITRAEKIGKLFTYLGKISYGIYMYHLVVMYLLLRYLPFSEWNGILFSGMFFLLSILLTFGVSALSYRFIESKFLSLKPKQNKP